MKNLNKNERWIPGFGRFYFIKDTGEVFSTRRRVNPSGQLKATDKAGYPSVGLYGRDKKRHSIGVHRLLALCFIPNPKKKAQVNHKNGDKSDYRLKNLEWVTASENAYHAVRTHLVKGARRMFTDDQVEKIKSLFSKGITRIEIANKLGVHRATIEKILSGKTYSYLAPKEE